MKVTIKEIAARTGVSFQTVSAALNGDLSRVSKSKRDTILETAKEMGYRSNLVAKSLRARKSYSIGILLPTPLDMFYASMVAQFQHLLSRSEYTGVFSFWSTYDEISAATENIMSRDLAAIITVEPSRLPEKLEMPVATYHKEDPRFDFVAYDFESSMQMAVEYLLGLGHSKIGYIGGTSGILWQAFVDIMNSKGLAENQHKYAANLDSKNLLDDAKVCESALLRLMSRKSKPTAIITSSDTVAFDVFQAAYKHGIRIPDDISIIGGDDLPIAKRLCPPLTTLKAAGESLPELLLEAVFNRMKNPELPRSRKICKVELVIRESCRKLATRQSLL